MNRMSIQANRLTIAIIMVIKCLLHVGKRVTVIGFRRVIRRVTKTIRVENHSRCDLKKGSHPRIHQMGA